MTSLRLVPREGEVERPESPAALSPKETFAFRMNEALSRLPQGDMTREMLESLDQTRAMMEEDGHIETEQFWLEQLEEILDG